MNEAKIIENETTEVGLTTATLAGAGVRPEVRAVASSSLSVGGASFVGAETVPAIDEQATPLFSLEEAKDFRARWDAVQVGFVDEPRQAYSRQIVSLQER
jgi:hypothetical protein